MVLCQTQNCMQHCFYWSGSPFSALLSIAFLTVLLLFSSCNSTRCIVIMSLMQLDYTDLCHVIHLESQVEHL